MLHFQEKKTFLTSQISLTGTYEFVRKIKKQTVFRGPLGEAAYCPVEHVWEIRLFTYKGMMVANLFVYSEEEAIKAIALEY